MFRYSKFTLITRNITSTKCVLYDYYFVKSMLKIFFKLILNIHCLVVTLLHCDLSLLHIFSPVDIE